jgi:hypothetical protein
LLEHRRRKLSAPRSTEIGCSGAVGLERAAWTVDRHRNLTVTADPVRVLQGAYRALLLNKAQDLGTPQ